MDSEEGETISVPVEPSQQPQHQADTNAVPVEPSSTASLSSTTPAGDRQGEENDLPPGWAEHMSPQGIPYYFNQDTKESRWVRPTKPCKKLSADLSEESQVPGNKRRRRGSGAQGEVEQAVEELSEDRKLLQSQLSSKDAVLDPRVKKWMSQWLAGAMREKRRSSPSERDIEHLIEMLCSGYEGYGEYIRLMMRWLDMIGGEKRPTLGETSAMEHFKHLCLAEFSLEKFSSIMEEEDRELPPVWLLQMLESPTWRNLLIVLANKNKSAPILDFCVKAICKAGYHAEVAQVMNTATYFAVFRRTFTDTLRSILAFDSTDSENNPGHLSKLEERLRELAGFSQYTYMFAMESLEYLEGSNEEGAVVQRKQSGLSAANQAKLRRLRQSLENIPRKPNDAAKNAAIQLCNPINRRSDGGLSASGASGGSPEFAALIRSFIADRKYTPEVIAQIRQYYDPQVNPNYMLMPIWPIRRLEFLMLLTQHLFDPYKEISKESLRDGAFVLAVIVARGAPEGAAFENKIFHEIEDALDICKDKETLSVEHLRMQSDRMTRLLELVKSNPPVAAGVIRFARSLFLSPAFHNSSCFTVGMRSLLSLIHEIIKAHPLQRVMVFYTIRHALPIHPTQVLSSKLMEIKQLMLDELITLMECGFVFQVIEFMRMQAENAHLDASLLRYFLVSLAKVAGDPLLPEFAKAALHLYNTETCSRAIRSSQSRDVSRIVNDFKGRCTVAMASAAPSAPRPSAVQTSSVASSSATNNNKSAGKEMMVRLVPFNESALRTKNRQLNK